MIGLAPVAPRPVKNHVCVTDSGKRYPITRVGTAKRRERVDAELIHTDGDHICLPGV